MTFGRDILRDVEGYVPGEQPKIPGIVKLNTNENPYPPSPNVLEALQALSEDALRKYPNAVSQELREVCAERYGYDSADWVIAGNGMDELLAMALRTFVDPGDDVLSVYPTYTLYEILTKLHGAAFRTVDLDEAYGLSESFYDESARLCFLPRPNAPSAVAISREDAERFCSGFEGIVVIDEAYVDFADDSCMDFPKRYENVIVMRTFSKSFSLAGMRIGVAVAQPDVIREFLKTKDSYNLNAFSQAAATAAMRDYGYMEENTGRIKATRGRLTTSLRGMGFSVPDSQTNFVLSRVPEGRSALDIFESLRERAILVRYFDERHLSDCLRISVGTDEEIDALLNALDDILGS